MAVAAIVIALVLTIELRSAIAVSGVAVLLYYALTNISTLTLDAEHRRWPRGIAVLGLVGCVVLMLSLPANALIGGGIVLAAGIAVRSAIQRNTQP